MTKFKIEDYKFDRNILFCGPPGVGKTYTAKKILAKFKKTNDSNLATYEVSDAKFKQFVKSNVLVLRKPEDWQCSYKKYPLEMMLRCKVLLFDDLGVSDITEAYLRDLTFVLDERIAKGLITIFTTNLGQSELSEKLNERIVSRVLGNTDVIVMDGEDKRLQTTKYFNM